MGFLTFLDNGNQHLCDAYEKTTCRSSYWPQKEEGWTISPQGSSLSTAKQLTSVVRAEVLEGADARAGLHARDGSDVRKNMWSDG